MPPAHGVIASSRPNSIHAQSSACYLICLISLKIDER